MIAGLATALVFVIGGLLMHPRPRSDEIRTLGTVVESTRGWSGGERAWLYTIEFHDTAGNAWRFEPPLTSARRRELGSTVEVGYSPSAPQTTARKIDGLDGYVHWVVVGTGVAIAIGSLLTLLF